MALPAGAELEQSWAAPELTADQSAQLAAALEVPSSDSATVADYETACAVVLRRVDVAAEAARSDVADLPTTALPALPTSVAAVSPRRAEAVGAVTAGWALR